MASESAMARRRLVALSKINDAAGRIAQAEGLAPPATTAKGKVRVKDMQEVLRLESLAEFMTELADKKSPQKPTPKAERTPAPTIDDIEKMSILALREFASANNIDLGEAVRKPDLVAIIAAALESKG